jgi:hypothetical protein
MSFKTPGAAGAVRFSAIWLNTSDSAMLSLSMKPPTVMRSGG